MTFKLRRLSAADADFNKQLDALLSSENQDQSTSIDEQVSAILTAVRAQGDAAVLQYTKLFDELDCKDVSDLEITAEQLLEAYESCDQSEKDALNLAKQRIEKYHSYQELKDWSFTDEFGHTLGQRVSPMGSAGLYVPGGKASYPSSVLMNATPAKVAGVKELVMMVPAPRGQLNPLVLAAAHLVGVDKAYTIGGAQAIAALAYGTETIPRVDKIVGPGNQYVAAAKRQVFGSVGIDMVAGPSEILIYADSATSADWLAMDMFSQAEHDEMAQAILICEDESVFQKVEASINKLLPQMDRAKIIQAALESRGAFIQVANRHEAITLINRIAPEHLELAFEDDEAELIAQSIDHAGAIFIGRATAEVFGDYCAGSNHVLPTSGSARFSSSLSVYDFLKRTSLVKLNGDQLTDLIENASTLAKKEGLDAHAKSADFRKELTIREDLSIQKDFSNRKDITKSQ